MARSRVDHARAVGRLRQQWAGARHQRPDQFYVGTVRYHRNEFFEVTKAAIVDDYDRANAEFKKKFGTKTPLRKALLTPVK